MGWLGRGRLGSATSAPCLGFAGYSDMGEEGKLLVDLISNLGSLGFVFWLVLRTTNHTIPRLAKSFEESMKQTREDFRDIGIRTRDDFREILEETRSFYAAQIERERQFNELQNNRLIEALKELKGN